MDSNKTEGNSSSAQNEPDVLFVPPGAPDKVQEYYFGIPGTSYDAWPDLRTTQTRLQIPGPKKETPEYQYFQFPPALKLSSEPGAYCIPQELLKFKPTDDEIHKYFFKGTSKEVYIRQIFFHTGLTQQEQEWLTAIRDYCRWKNFPVRSCLDPFLLRLCYYNWRKNGDKGYVAKAYEHIIETTNWRANIFPLSDTDPEIKEDLARGVMYWTARDESLRPLLVVRLRRLPNNTPPARFKRLTVFCFEWGMKYLFVPGLVETCTVVFDVRGIAIHSFPISALSDMTNTLTRQYPFRLDRMFIINDSLFIQTVWSIAKQFLTEVQQQKMAFMRTGYDKELLKIYAPHHLEKEFGGTRPEIKSYYPFPLAPGPFKPGSKGPDTHAAADCWKALGPETSRGQFWIGDNKPDITWGQDAHAVFKRCGLPPPSSCVISPSSSSSSPAVGSPSSSSPAAALPQSSPPLKAQQQQPSGTTPDGVEPSPAGAGGGGVIQSDQDSLLVDHLQPGETISGHQVITPSNNNNDHDLQPLSFPIDDSVERHHWHRRSSSDVSSASSGNYLPRRLNSYRPPPQQFLPSLLYSAAAAASPTTDDYSAARRRQESAPGIPAPGGSGTFKVADGDVGHSDDDDVKQFEEKQSLNHSDETAENTPPASAQEAALVPGSPATKETQPLPPAGSTTKKKKKGLWSKLCCRGAEVAEK